MVTTRNLEFPGLMGIPRLKEGAIFSPKPEPRWEKIFTGKQEMEDALKNSSVVVLPSDSADDYDVVVYGKKMESHPTLETATEKAAWYKLFLSGKLGSQTEKEFSLYKTRFSGGNQVQ